MRFNNALLANDLERHMQNINLKDRSYKNCMIRVEDVLYAHYHIVDFFYNSPTSENRVGGIGPKDLNMLCSAVARQSWEEDPYDSCASLLFGLIQNHPFHDCNKRTAILTAFYNLRLMKRIPSSSHSSFEKLTVNIARHKLKNYKEYAKLLRKDKGEIKTIANFLKNNTRAIEYDKPSITYNELNSILSRNGFKIDNPSKGYIDIIEVKKPSTFMKYLKSKTTKNAKLGRMIFKGWSREVEPAGLDRVRQITGLTLDQGYDSKSFFRGADSLPSLIQEYSEMLKRLADK